MKKFLAEFIGTFLMVFIGTGSVIINSSHTNIGQVGIGISFGIAVSLSIYLFAKFSGAHINPAVSFAFFLKKQLKFNQLLGYILFQIFGALLASALLHLFFPSNPVSLGATIPSGSWQESFILEFFLTFALMLIILIVQKRNLSVLYASLIIGITVGLEACFFGPISGASMNPARSIAPAIVSLNINYLWLYILATSMGSCFALLPFYFKGGS